LETLQKTVRAGNPLPCRDSARGSKTNASDACFCLVALERSQAALFPALNLNRSDRELRELTRIIKLFAPIDTFQAYQNHPL
jgi:hypothetical protein